MALKKVKENKGKYEELTKFSIFWKNLCFPHNIRELYFS